MIKQSLERKRLRYRGNGSNCNEISTLFWELRGLSPTHSCVRVCERFIHSQDRSTYFPAAEYADRSWEYINRSQTHECGNWDFGHAILFVGIFVSNFGIVPLQRTRQRRGSSSDWAHICKRLRSPGIDSANLFSLAGRYDNPICRT